ncbi:MAG: four helix bundle protein [Chitinophagales bacterium]
MPTIKRFEDLEVWKKARILANEVWGIINEGTLAKDFKLRDQMNDSSGSIMDNIAEGFERSSRLEFINFLSISKGSAGELRSQFYRALDRKHIDQKKFQELFDKIEEIGKMLGGFIDYLNESEIRGKKFEHRSKLPTR